MKKQLLLLLAVCLSCSHVACRSVKNDSAGAEIEFYKEIPEVNCKYYLKQLKDSTVLDATIDSANLPEGQPQFSLVLSKNMNSQLLEILQRASLYKVQEGESIAWDCLASFYIYATLPEKNISFKIAWLEKDHFYINDSSSEMSFNSPELKEFIHEIFKRHLQKNLSLISDIEKPQKQRKNLK